MRNVTFSSPWVHAAIRIRRLAGLSAVSIATGVGIKSSTVKLACAAAPGFKDVRSRFVSSSVDLEPLRMEGATATLFRIEKSEENGRTVEARPAQPIDIAFARNKRGAVHIADQRIIAYRNVRARFQLDNFSKVRSFPGVKLHLAKGEIPLAMSDL
jgi:hypothetical protein